MKKNPSLLEGLGAALLAALLITSGILLAGSEDSIQTDSGSKIIPTALSTEIQPEVDKASATRFLPTTIPSPTICPKPGGWEPYIMRSGDSLETLAGERKTNLIDVVNANCLDRPGAMPGSIIYLPPPPATLTPTVTNTATITPTPTQTLRPCDYPSEWVRYEINAGDSLFKLGVRFHVSEVELATGNCLSLQSVLQPGETILVPTLPTNTPTPG